MRHRQSTPERDRRVRTAQVTTAVALVALAALLVGLLVTRSPSSSARQDDVAATGADPTTSVTASASPTPSATPTSPPATPSPTPVPVAFLGDGLTPTVPVPGASSPPAGSRAAADDWAAEAAAVLTAGGTPVTGATAAQDGAGYASLLPGGQNIAELVPQVVTGATRVVVLRAGARDVGKPADAVVTGAETALQVVHQVAPTAKVLVIGPDGADARSAAVSAAVHRAADAEGATFADPVALGWPSDGSDGSDGSGGPDGADPAALGRQVAALVAPLLG